MLASPLRGNLIRTGKYGKRGEVPVGGGKVSSSTHLGVDIRAASGTPFYPLEPGVVVQTRKGWSSHARPGTIAGSRIFTDSIGGNLVVVRGKSGDITYNHAQSIAVNVGAQVSTGTILGRTGTTGGVAPHLHVGIWPRDGKGKWAAVDPTPLLPWTGDKFGELTIKALNPVEGFLMALTDEEQKRLLERTDKIYGWAEGLAFGNYPRQGDVADKLAAAASAGADAKEARRLAGELWRINIVPGTAFPYLAVLLSELRASAGTTGSLDSRAIAKSIVDALGPELVGPVADELGKRIKNG